MIELSILEYQTADGTFPYQSWLKSLDKKAAATVAARVNRLRIGNFGDWKRVGEGAFELRIDFGPGYRVYFGRDGNTVVVLLCGGTKRSQTADIKRAIKNWSDYEKSK